MSVAEPENLVLTTPKWLEALENKRKRPHRLAHDIGAGSPCLVCKEKCKGLNLHFWRKICIECKCRKEDHDFEEEEDYAQFELLFGAKKTKRTTLKFNAQNKTFDWIPPNVPQDLAVDYLKALPQSKLPISNTEGAKYRKQQLEKQLPLHDVDPDACHDLTDKELKEFEKYLDNLRSHVIGQGKVLKYQKPQLYKEKVTSCGPPSINQTSLNQQQKLNPEWAGSLARLTIDKITSVNNAVSEKVNTESFPAESILKIEPLDKTQAFSEYPKGTFYSPQSNKSSQIKPEYLNSQNLNNFVNPQTEFSSQVSPKIADISLPCPKPYKTSVIHNPCEENINSTEILNNEGRSSPLLKTPSSFIQRISPVFDKRNNNATFQHQDDNCNEKLEPLPLAETIQHSIHPSNLVYSQGSDALADLLEKSNSVPYQKPCEASLNADLVRNFNGMNVSSDQVPFVPVQESQNISARKGVASPIQHEAETKLPDILTETLPVPPQTCRQCFEALSAEDIVVQTERGGNSALWHARCFICETCKELLVDLMYFFNKGKVYCGRHYAELMNIPRCFACDELIFVKEYTCAEGENYHFRHFCCFHCDEPLGGNQYIVKDGQPVCLQCYQVKYGKDCHTCHKPITAGEQRVSWKELNFHVSPQCFRCAKCLNSLLGGKFMVKNNNTFCSKECIQNYIQ